MQPALIIFIKNPVFGKVKTRLAQAVGEEAALAVYRKLLDITHLVAEQTTVKKFLFYSDFIAENDGWDEQIFSKNLQTGAGLGERMSSAFKSVFQHHAPVVIIGSDCPALSEVLVNQAFEILKTTSVVIGPATDGGYYLIGVRQFFPALFQNIEWSTPKVLDQTTAILNHENIDFQLLLPLADLDTWKDLQASGLLELPEFYALRRIGKKF